MRVFLSAGHTPERPGAVIPDYEFDERLDLREHDLAHRIVSDLAGALRVARPEVVPALRLSQRIAYINRWSEPGDLAVEIHLNAAPSERANGAEAFYYGDSATGRHLGFMLVARIADLGRRRRGAKRDTRSHAGSLSFLRRTKPWAALVEVEFITNPDARAWLIEPQGMDELGNLGWHDMPGWRAAALSMAWGLDEWAKERA